MSKPRTTTVNPWPYATTADMIAAREAATAERLAAEAASPPAPKPTPKARR